MTKAKTHDFTEMFHRGLGLLNAGWPIEDIIADMRDIARQRLVPKLVRKDGVRLAIEAEERCWFIGMEFREWLQANNGEKYV